MPGPTDGFRYVAQWQDIMPLLASTDPADHQSATDALVRRDMDLEDHLADSERSGTSTVATDASGDVTITYTRPFAFSTDQVQITPRGNNLALAYSVEAVTAATFRVRWWTLGVGAPAIRASLTTGFDYLAKGR